MKRGVHKFTLSAFLLFTFHLDLSSHLKEFLLLFIITFQADIMRQLDVVKKVNCCNFHHPRSLSVIVIDR